ncbi:hypothetical protein HMH05_19465 [Pseudomonas sp. SbB1]|uniref:Uncharacterized protein n=2 Tax=Pseudomonas TaxID=286 RepID=B0KSX9_PSEPG|nr:hypothetical protein PputGB1_4177 [Pseudomonas putida GB-1]EKT4564067.1 hypothetical protein [Pseudomonas putida]MBP0707848.1 hypothetical protein [Pseudomonas sp. T34]NOG89964.1 hypothetical protein [Pseudomonas sp. SbB1]ELF6208695.1 hypothetical protein [Pseudomonas putida]
MSFIPSCDDRDDAIRSLSEIYGVTSRDIERVLGSSRVKDMATFGHQIESAGFRDEVGRQLRASPRGDITHAFYYHSTSYGGCSSWFDEGLHGSSLGVGCFLDKITELLPPELHLECRQAAKRIVERRSNDEGTTASQCGPYAWNTFTAASFSESGQSFRVPEAIRDLGVRSPDGEEVDLPAIIRDRLKPVVVKFKGEITDIVDYCVTLWGYLLSDDGELHLLHTFHGDGLSIPKEDIVALIDVS